METKYVRVPFEVELAKKIQNKECDGRIVTDDGRSVRIVCWDRKDNYYPIIALIEKNHGCEEDFYFTVNGMYCSDKESCYDLVLEIPEYMTFKDGDVLVSYEGVVLLFDGTVNKYDFCGCYCSLYCDSHDLDLNYDYKGVFHETRKANENERNEMINKLKASKDPLAKDYLKRFFGIEVKQEYEFKPFDKVLARSGKQETWNAYFFSHYNSADEYRYVTLGGLLNKYCIPYNEQTAHLLGTTEIYE